MPEVMTQPLIASVEATVSMIWSISAISSAGSLENVKLLRDNEAQFAILQGVFAAWAWNGEGPVRNPQTEMRSVSAMWLNVEHFVLLTELVKNGTLSDFGTLQGERVVLGARNSGADQSGRFILEQLGIDYESAMTFGYMGYDMVRFMEELPEPNPDTLGLPDSMMIRPTVMAIFDSVRE